MTSDTYAEERMLGFTRTLDASPRSVWRCWTEPELLKQWFTPKPWETVAADIDLRPGGRNVVTMRGPSGEEHVHRGLYLDVVPFERLVFTDAFVSAWEPSNEAFMVGTVTMADAGGGRTLYTAAVRHWSAEARARHEAMGFYEGWGKATDQLEELARRLDAGKA